MSVRGYFAFQAGVWFGVAVVSADANDWPVLRIGIALSVASLVWLWVFRPRPPAPASPPEDRR